MIIPAAHALTGCDSVSSIFGIGKKKIFNLLTERGAERYLDLKRVGFDEEEGQKAAEKFVCDLYATKKHHPNDINKLRIKKPKKISHR